MYLQLSQSEATTGTDTAVVLDSRASHNRSELVNRTGCEGGSLSLAGNASRGLLAGLYSKTSPSDTVCKQSHGALLLTQRNSIPPLPCVRKTHHLWVGSPSRAYLVEVTLNPTLPVLSEV